MGFLRFLKFFEMINIFENRVGMIKEAGSCNVNKPVIFIIYIAAHTWPLCSAQILVDGVNTQESYLQKSTNISAIA